ncbi:MAG: SURF1 family protein [Propionivibrio sp.]
MPFRPQFWPTLAAALLIPLFLAAGQWQWNKAEKKAQLQSELETLASGPAIAMPTTLADADALRFRRVTARGHYEPEKQILIDNRTYQGRAGYHVITPLRLEGSDLRVLVNRGWVPGLAEHHEVPVIDTPNGLVEAEGVAIVPSTRFFTLGTSAAPANAWQNVWQNLDLQRYAAEVGFPVQPVVLQLDAQSPAGGFVRDWPRPDDRRQVNVGYALQWWSFAATTIFLWLFFNLRRARSGRQSSDTP